jgi:hypothetical protein
MAEVLIGRQQHQIVLNTQLRQERIDGPDLNAAAAAQIRKVAAAM